MCNFNLLLSGLFVGMCAEDQQCLNRGGVQSVYVCMTQCCGISPSDPEELIGFNRGVHCLCVTHAVGTYTCLLSHIICPNRDKMQRPKIRFKVRGEV